MARVKPIRREEAPELEDVFSRAEKALGFVPNSFLAMGRSPDILRAFTRLAREVIGVSGKVPLPLKHFCTNWSLANRFTIQQEVSSRRGG